VCSWENSTSRKLSTDRASSLDSVIKFVTGIEIQKGLLMSLRSTIYTETNQTRTSTRPSPKPLRNLLAVRTFVNKGPIRVLTPTTPILRTLDTPSPIPTFLSLDTRLIPKERPGPGFGLHRRARCAVVRFACAVGKSVVAIVLVVLDEDGKGLAGCAGVVAALCGLDCFAGFDG
jgi:hypothetical protein